MESLIFPGAMGSSTIATPRDVTIESTPNQISPLAILAPELIWELCETLLAPEWRETLLDFAQVCKGLQYFAIMTYTGFKDSDINRGELAISNAELSALPHLVQMMSRWFSGIEKLSIKFAGTPDVILDRIHYLGHLPQHFWQLMPSLFLSTDFEFKFDLPGDVVQVNTARAEFATALELSPLAEICQKLIGTTGHEANRPSKTTLITGGFTSYIYPGFRSCHVVEFDDQQRHSLDNTGRDLANSMKGIASCGVHGSCQLRRSSGADALIIINGHTIQNLHIGSSLPMRTNWNSLLPHIQLPLLERFSALIGPQTDLSVYFDFVERHKPLLRILSLRQADKLFLMPTPFCSVPLNSLEIIRATPQLIAHLFPVLHLPNLRAISFEECDDHANHLEPAFKEMTKFRTLESLELRNVSRKSFAALAPSLQLSTDIPRLLSLEGFKSIFGHASVEGQPSRVQRGLLHALGYCTPGLSIALRHPSANLAERRRILVPEIIGAVKRAYPRIEMTEHFSVY